MICNRYCNQDLWCANSFALCNKNIMNDKQLEYIRKNIGFFTLKPLSKNRKCNDNHKYTINFRCGNYLNISKLYIPRTNSKEDVIKATIELLSSLYIVSEELKNKYSLYEILVLSCKIRHYICIDFISLNSFLVFYKNSIINRISEKVDKNKDKYKDINVDNIQYNDFPNYIAILNLTRNHKDEKSYKKIKAEDMINNENKIILSNLSVDIPYKIACHINKGQINNLINVLNNPHKITAKKLNFMRSKQR